MLNTFYPYQAADALGTGPPQDSTLKQASPKHFKVIAHQLGTLLLAHIGKTLLQIDIRHQTTLFAHRMQQNTQAIAHPYDHTERQKMYQPQNKHTQAHQHYDPL
jgi:hypothetical protein